MDVHMPEQLDLDIETDGEVPVSDFDIDLAESVLKAFHGDAKAAIRELLLDGSSLISSTRHRASCRRAWRVDGSPDTSGSDEAPSWHQPCRRCHKHRIHRWRRQPPGIGRGRIHGAHLSVEVWTDEPEAGGQLLETISRSTDFSVSCAALKAAVSARPGTVLVHLNNRHRMSAERAPDPPLPEFLRPPARTGRPQHSDHMTWTG